MQRRKGGEFGFMIEDWYIFQDFRLYGNIRIMTQIVPVVEQVHADAAD